MTLKTLESGDEFYISNKTFFMQGGIYVKMVLS